MGASTFFAVTAVLGVIYGLMFVFFSGVVAPLYGIASPNAHTILESQFFGAALIWLAAISWFARDFRDWNVIRSLLISAVIGSVFGLGVNLLATFQGLLSAMAWTSTVVYVLVIVWALYLISAGPKAAA